MGGAALADDVVNTAHELSYQQRGDSFPLIFYADFTDLSEIICRRDNWNVSFHQLFASKPDLHVSLQRLIPVRKAIAHNRPLVRTDQIVLFSEAYRILAALGVQLKDSGMGPNVAQMAALSNIFRKFDLNSAMVARPPFLNRIEGLHA